jgi:ABC-2 type transport system ATP-binding protein
MNRAAEGSPGRPRTPEASGVAALEVRNVSKVYYPPTHWLRRRRPDDSRLKHALRGLSLRVNQGEMVALLGPNGAGKTTLLKIIATLIHPSGGEVSLFGVDVRADPYHARGMMGLVTCDERSFFWRLTGRQNLNFFGALYGLSRQEIARQSAELLETLDLASAADRPYHSYSSGMKQKLAIARGLLSQPMLLIYDEPTRSLDPLSAQNIRQWIRTQRRRLPHQTHLIATNQLTEAQMLCDYVVIINGGRLIAQGTVDEIRALADIDELDSFRVDVKGGRCRQSIAGLQHPDIVQLRVEETVDGVSLRFTARRDGAALTAVLAEVIRSGDTVTSCDAEQTSFDEVFCAVIESQTAAERAA